MDIYASGRGNFIVDVSVASTNTSFEPTLSITAPDGTVLCNLTNRPFVRYVTTGPVSQTGTYTVAISRWDATTTDGSYTISMIATPGPYTVSSGDEGGSLVNGQIYKGSVYRGDLDAWTFDVTAGLGYFVGVSATDPSDNFDLQLLVYDPSGAEVYSTIGSPVYICASLNAVMSGRYTAVVMRSASGDDRIANYSINIAIAAQASVVPAGDEGGAMVDGTYSGAVYRGDLDSWYFDAAAGSNLSVSLADTNGSIYDLELFIYDPNGSYVYSNYGKSLTYTGTAAVSGMYTIVVFRLQGDDAGAYSLSLTGSSSSPPSPAGKDLGDSVADCGCPKSQENPVSVGDPKVADPITLSNGNLFERATDYQTAGANPLAFIRYYNSQASALSVPFASVLGVNWRSNYDRYIRILSPSSVTAERADGRIIGFVLSGSTWKTDTDVDPSLSQSGLTWTLTDSNDVTETYTAVSGTEAALSSIRWRNGYTQTLVISNGQVTGITDSYNRSLSFTYTSGLLHTVTTPDGLVLTYGYTPIGTSNVLTSISYNTNPVTSETYLYEDTAYPFALTGIIDEDGNRYATWSYDADGRATSSQHAKGADYTQIGYDDATGNRIVTGPLGEQETYKFQTLQSIPKVVEIDRAANPPVAAATRTFTYDSNGYLNSATDWNGNSTTYLNNSQGQPTTINEAVGSPVARTTTIVYDSTWVHLPHTITTAALTTTLNYDPNNGNLLTKVLTDTTTTTVPYSTNGETRTWTYTWTGTGQLQTLLLPRTDVQALTQFGYDSSGALIQITNALEQKTKITQHTGGGRPKTIVDANNVVTTLTYDGRLNLSSSTVKTSKGNLTTTYGHDAAEDLASIQLPDLSTLAYGYDQAHRLDGITDLFGQAIAYTLDAAGNRKLVTFADSTNTTQRKHSGIFDAVSRTSQDIGGVGQTTNYSYDNNGNATIILDPLTNQTTQGFDALNRLSTIIDPAPGGTTVVTFDAHDRPLTVTAPNGAVTSYVYDGFGDTIQVSSPDTGITINYYDLDGNLAQTTNAAKALANYTYDALDRILTTTYPSDATENVVYTYDQSGHGSGVGRLTSLTDAAGTLSRTYDERGNMLTETRTDGSATLKTAYGYDAASRVSSITYPSKWLVTYTRDKMGRVTGVNAAKGGGTTMPVVSNITYEPFGPMTGMTFGNGVAEGRTFDLDYRLGTLADTGTSPIQNLTYGYDADNNVKTITDAITSANSQTLGYDTLNRLNGAAGGYGSLTYTYDTSGNRLTQKSGFLTTKYNYTPNSNILNSLTMGATTTETYGYSGTGNISSFSPGIRGSGSAPITALTYNQANRLATVLAGTSQVAGYTYDAFGRRIVKATGKTTLYQHDRAGNLLEETSSTGMAQVDYVYVDGTPIATIAPASGKLYFINNDRLGTPQLATDSSQAIAWQALYQPFGTTGGVSGLITQNLRLPGQQFDAETGFNHNGFRDYLSNLGRYLQSDPVGLRGGTNTYAYSNVNPLRFSDFAGTHDDQTGSDQAIPVTDSFDKKWIFTFNLNAGAVALEDDFDNPQLAANRGQACQSALKQIDNGQKQLELTTHAITALDALPDSTSLDELLIWLDKTFATTIFEKHDSASPGQKPQTH